MSHSSLVARLDRLEAKVIRSPSRPMSKMERDALVHRFSTPADFAAMLAGETDPQRCAAIEAAMRADS